MKPTAPSGVSDPKVASWREGLVGIGWGVAWLVGIVVLFGSSFVRDRVADFKLMRSATVADGLITETGEDVEEADDGSDGSVSYVLYTFHDATGRRFEGGQQLRGQLPSDWVDVSTPVAVNIEYLAHDPSVNRLYGEGSQTFLDWAARAIVGAVFLLAASFPGLLLVREGLNDLGFRFTARHPSPAGMRVEASAHVEQPDLCPYCGKVAKEKFSFDGVDKEGNPFRLITLECFHVLKKALPKVTHAQRRHAFPLPMVFKRFERSGFWAAAVASIAVAFALASMPYGYYMLLRALLCGISLFLLLGSTLQLRDWEKWLLGACAVMYNPIFPISLGSKAIWTILNVVTVVLFWLVARRRAAT